jgi:hypothetical protein
VRQFISYVCAEQECIHSLPANGSPEAFATQRDLQQAQRCCSSLATVSGGALILNRCTLARAVATPPRCSFLRENDFDTLVVGDLIDIWSLRRGFITAAPNDRF